jgi:hypothetical protein
MTNIVGIFPYLEDVIHAIKELKQKNPKKMLVYAPMPSHEINEAMEPKTSPVRYFTLAGALFGLFGGFGVSIWSSIKWGLITGGKPIVSIPPFVVVGFEMTILFGALATLVGLIIVLNSSAYRISNTYDSRFSVDKYGIAIQVPSEEKENYKDILHSSGAEEINVR